MKKKLDNNETESIADLKKFYTQKKNEQEALRRLLKALERKSENEKEQNNASTN